MSKSTLSFSERMAIHDRLKELVTITEPGSCHYEPGHSDATVAEQFGCTVHNVSGIRQEVFGKIRTPVLSSSDLASVRQRLDDHQAKLDAVYQLAMRMAAEHKFGTLREAVRLRELFGDQAPAIRG